MMEASQDLCEQDRLQLITEKRKWQTEVESRKRQLEDDRRTLQHLKSKALRERWLLDGAPSAGPDQDNVKKQLEQDEATTRNLEETINRLELELLGLLCQTETQTTMSTGSNEAHKSPRMNKSRETTEEMKRAMYSVEIKVERDRQTGESRVLSTNTTLPVDLSQQGVKVYEDEQKVVHEVNGEDGVHLLSSSEVDELILKADEALMMSQTVSTVTSIPTVEYQEEAEPELPHISVEITGLEAKPLSEPSVADASAENPVTMVFMGYQSVEDESETKKVLGLQGTVTAELVLIDDADGKTSPGGGGMDDGDSRAKTTQHPPASAASTPLTTTRPPAATPASNRESAGEAEGRVVDLQKEKQACKCCSIM
ncbi:paralemmin 1a isoform X2 [Hippoglossus hippoglossus]|uniref:paralemmin 1a isoform X2 n=1 Tax=Hippoglossus hippoglossus TaxID=8267 RepID=UPI00148BFF40|nr:paralemmin 1a isoform X2 [Hippoglossus hippoglossus]XP_035033187.1 paralemmin 1a isoform X2 [Hippoglossus stenolepis]